VQSLSPSESTLWLVDLARGGTSRLSSGPGRNDSPVWSPDNKRVVWAGDRSGPQAFYIKNVNDAAPEQLLFGSDVPFKNPVAWSPDGNWIVVGQLDQGTAQNIYLLEASGKKEPALFLRGPARDNAGPVSPDGKWLAHMSDDSSRFELYLQSFPTPGRKVQVSEKGAVNAWWSRDGRQLTFLGGDLRSLWRVDLQPAESMGVGTPRQFATLPPDVVWVAAMPDHRRFLAIAPERTGTGSVTVVQNWLKALR